MAAGCITKFVATKIMEEKNVCIFVRLTRPRKLYFSAKLLFSLPTLSKTVPIGRHSTFVDFVASTDREEVATSTWRCCRRYSADNNFHCFTASTSSKHNHPLAHSDIALCPFLRKSFVCRWHVFNTRFRLIIYYVRLLVCSGHLFFLFWRLLLGIYHRWVLRTLSFLRVYYNCTTYPIRLVTFH